MNRGLVGDVGQPPFATSQVQARRGTAAGWPLEQFRVPPAGDPLSPFGMAELSALSALCG
jgi:hypothetical protein